MKNITKKCLVLLGLGLPMVGNAASEWSNWYPVSQVFIQPGGTLFLNLNPNSAHPNPAGCASASWLRAPVDEAFTDRIYQMALTAQASGMKVNVRIDGCQGSYPKIIQMRTLAQ